MPFHEIRDKWFCWDCGREAENIGITPVPVWHCFNCEPMERAKDILEWGDGELDTEPLFPLFSWGQYGGNTGSD